MLVMLCLHSSFYMASDSIQRPASNVCGRLCCPESRKWLLDDPTSENRILRHAAQAGKTNVSYEKIFETLSLITGRLNPLNYNLFVCCKVVQ